MAQQNLDAVVVGAGFAGIYQIKKLIDIGLTNSLVIDQAGDVGGTWYWNLYPGAMSDTESYVYRFSWDKEDLLEYPFKEHYVKQPEVLAYLEHVVERHGLRKYMQFDTELLSAEWDEESQRWDLTLTGGKKVTARYLITGLGLLSKQNYPDIPGIDSFQGDIHHSAKWPRDYSLHGKRAGIIGCGSTGVQIITDIGSKVESLVCFQRHPQYSVPSGDQPVTPEYRSWIDENWDDIFKGLRNSFTGFGFKESELSYHSASPEDRERIFEENWQKGNGFRFMFGTFCDISIDAEANEGACEFIRKKIREIVKDPEKARKLQPHDVYARRPLCDGNAQNGQKYFEQFNRPNVDIVDLKETPITRIEPAGVRTSDGVLHELELLILATGFDAVEGNYNRIAIKGRGGVSLKDAWDVEGPTSKYRLRFLASINQYG
jgi:cyclohexanone monooxygenase